MNVIDKIDYEQSFVNGIEEVISHKAGKKPLSSKTVCVPAINPSDIRSALKISQHQFAERFGIPISTLKNWEQGRRDPDQPTSLLLYLISKFPNQIANELVRLKSNP